MECFRGGMGAPFASTAWTRFVVISAFIAGCGGRAAGDGSPDAAIANGDAGGADARSPGPAPTAHRPSATSCAPSPVPPEPIVSDAGLGPGATFECRVHSDCTAHPRGRCLFYPTNPPVDPGGTRCVYECLSDADCAVHAACSCGDTVSTCIVGNCRVDDDCGSGGFCSPTLDGCGLGPAGYYCHTSADTCLDDRDCDAKTIDKCIFNDAAKRWSCSPVGCE